MPSEFTFVIRDLPDVRVVAFRGELDLATVGGLAEALITISGPLVVADLADLTFMDSTGIGALALARKEITAAGNRLVITRPQGIVRRALDIVGMGDWIEEWSPEWDG